MGYVDGAVDGAEAYADEVAAGKLDIAAALGVGQTWQNATGSRALNTTYTNTSGRPIMVSVNSSVNPSGADFLSILVNNVTAAISLANSTCYGNSMTVIVPPGATYRAIISGGTGTSKISYWAELR
jgi:hypothetical protein